MFLLFAAAVAAFLYPYVLFPALLAVLARKNRSEDEPSHSSSLPSVSILVSAYNEAPRIADKIHNFQLTDYATDRLDLWIGSDGSEDDTARILAGLRAPRVHLVERKERSGKTSVLNDLASGTGATILIFTDVNALFRPDTVRRLAEPFADPRVGLVSGRTVIRGNDGQVEVEGAYYQFESWLKAKESSRGWLAGADGAVYALRASLYRELGPELINDLTHPCQVAALGFESRFEPLAISEEGAGDDPGREFARQTRMTAQAAYVLATQMPALISAGRFGQLWVLLSHKWLRWIAGLWLIAGAAVLLSFLSLPLAGVTLLGAVALFGALLKTGRASLPVYFLLVHLAYLNGLWRAILGDRYVVWKPREG